MTNLEIIYHEKCKSNDILFHEALKEFFTNDSLSFDSDFDFEKNLVQITVDNNYEILTQQDIDNFCDYMLMGKVITYEITSMINDMPIENTTLYKTESEAIQAANKLGLIDGIDYMITWCEE